MTTYHAVMLDETGCEFGVSVPEDRGGLGAHEWLRENYPESRCVQLETPEQSAEREAEVYRRAARDYDEGDDYYDYDEEEDYDDFYDEE